MHRSAGNYVLVGALTVAYYAAAKTSLNLFDWLHPSAAAVWLPTGIAIAALLIAGYRVWPAIFIGAFLASVTTAGSVATSLGIAGGNTLEGLAAAYLVNRFAGGRKVFTDATYILRYTGLAALASPVLSATIGVASLILGGYASVAQMATAWLPWWLGDAASAMVVAPVLILWHADRGFDWPLRQVVEALLLLDALLLTGLVAFLDPDLRAFSLAFLCIPALVWAAFRFGQREVATAVAVLSAVAIVATASGNGPFSMETPTGSLLVLQAFMTLLAVTGLSMAALNAQRTSLLARERTLRAEAEAANRAKDEFLAVLSHELRNPLEAISAAEAALDTVPDGTARSVERWRSVIRRQTRHLTRLIDDLLDIARVTTSKLGLEREPMNLASAAERCAGAVAALPSSKGARIELDAEEAWIEGDPHRIEQIVQNLLSNAIKHTPAEGLIEVTVRPEQHEAVLRVKDNGAGIGADLLPLVFEPFVQGKQGPERAAGGLGLGLALVRRLAHLHGGEVEADSRGPGAGSLFTVRLPRIERPSAQHTAAAEHGRRPGRGRILLVEDNEDTRDALLALLLRAGYDVQPSADGRSALDAALRLMPDLVLLDIGLPGLDGYEVARRLRATSPQVGLIALTGYGRDEDKRSARDAGFDAHLLKPVDFDRLSAVVADVLARRGAVGAAAPV